MTTPAPQDTWATVPDVSQLTGRTVSEETIYQANALLEIEAGRTYADVVATPTSTGQPVRAGARDIEWMRRACAYQAAWLAVQPDAFSRMDVTSSSAGGQTVQLAGRALSLAPLARRALRRVSWLRSRSVHIRGAYTDGPGPVSPNADAEVDDDAHAWAAI